MNGRPAVAPGPGQGTGAPRPESQRGSALLEAAFALPIFLLLVLSAFDIGRVAQAHSAAFNAAREGARVASTDPASTSCVRAAAIRIGGLRPLAAGDIAYAPPVSPRIGDEVTVTIATTLDIVTPLIASAIGRDTAPIHAMSRMQIRHVPPSPGTCAPL